MRFIILLLALPGCAQTKYDHFAAFQSRLADASQFCEHAKPLWPYTLAGWKDGCFAGYLRSCGPTYCPPERK